MTDHLRYGEIYKVLIPASTGFDNLPATPCFNAGIAHDTVSIPNGATLRFYSIEKPGGDVEWFVFALDDAAVNEPYNWSKKKLVYVPKVCLPYISPLYKKTKQRYAVRSTSSARSKRNPLIRVRADSATAGNIATAPAVNPIGLVPFRKAIRK